MRILQLIPSANPALGGPIEVVRQFGGTLLPLGHTTEVATLDDPGAAWIERFPFKVNALGPSRLNYCYSSRLIPWLKQQAHRFDCVIVNGLWQFCGFAARHAVKPLGIPYFVFPHGMLDPWFKRRYPFKHLKKWIYWLPAEYRILRDARAVIYTCEQEQLLARESFELYSCTEAIVNLGIRRPPTASSQQGNAFLDRFPQLRHKRLLLFLGRIHPKKGCDLLLNAFSTVVNRYPDVCLVMAGPAESDFEASLKTLAQKLGIESRIVWTGMLVDEMKWGAFQNSEVFVLPSHQENFGIAVAEALACGLPVLISDKINIHREIHTDNAGLVATDTVEGTTQLLERWLACPNVQRNAMRRAARACYELRFEVQRASSALIDVLRAHGVSG